MSSTVGVFYIDRKYWLPDQCLDLSCALGQLRNCNCATDLLWAVGAMRHLQDAIQATTAASELSALGGGASAASADPDAPENPADEIALGF